MIDAILSALWFFVPAGFANAMPVVAAKLPVLEKYDYPLDFHKTFRGHRIFGSHKTWRGVIFAFFTTLPLVYLQVYLYNHSEFIRDTSYFDYNNVNALLLTFLFTVGALGGDAIRSFFKRQAGVKPGNTWFPFDQMDYVIGGLLASSVIVQLEPYQYLIVGLTYFLLHPVVTATFYFLKVREKPI